MRKPQISKALGVGLLIAVAGIAFLVALTFFRKGGFSDKDSYVVHAYFSDATGLSWKSKVQIAGIQIGEVSRIDLEGMRARLEIRVKNEIDVRTDACLTKSYPSALLPDALLQLFSGSSDRRAMRDLPAAEREITCVRESASMQQLMDSMAKVATDVQKLTGDLAMTVGGDRGSMREIVENLASLTRRIEATVDANAGSIDAILRNAQGFSADLREISHSEKERIKAIAVNVEELSGQLRRVATSVEKLLEGEGAGGAAVGADGKPVPGAAQARGEAGGIRKSVDRVNESIARLNELVAKVQEGKSVAGKLLVDEKLGRQVGDAVSGAAEYVDRMMKLQIEMNMRAEWLYNQSAAKSYFGLRLLPRPDKYYLLDIISDPRGVDTVKTESSTDGTPAGTSRITTTTHEDKLTFSLQLAKRYGPMAFRAGIIESSGGLGMDAHLLDDSLQLSVSAYQFTRPQLGVLPRAKVWANYRFAKYFYVTGGADDFLNAWNTGRYPGGPRFSIGQDAFFGAGLSFRDDDLKVLFGSGITSAIPKSQ